MSSGKIVIHKSLPNGILKYMNREFRPFLIAGTIDGNISSCYVFFHSGGNLKKLKFSKDFTEPIESVFYNPETEQYKINRIPNIQKFDSFIPLYYAL